MCDTRYKASSQLTIQLMTTLPMSIFPGKKRCGKYSNMDFQLFEGNNLCVHIFVFKIDSPIPIRSDIRKWTMAVSVTKLRSYELPCKEICFFLLHLLLLLFHFNVRINIRFVSFSNSIRYSFIDLSQKASVNRRWYI